MTRRAGHARVTRSVNEITNAHQALVDRYNHIVILTTIFTLNKNKYKKQGKQERALFIKGHHARFAVLWK